MLRILSTILLISSISFADIDSLSPQKTQTHIYTTEEATNTTLEALAKRPDVILTMKNFENWFWNRSCRYGLTPELGAILAAAALPLISHKLSTRSMHMHWEPIKDLTLRPDIDYYYSTGTYNFAFTTIWRF